MFESHVTPKPAPREQYVDAVDASEFLARPLHRVLSWAASGLIPAHCLRHGKQQAWKFKLSELALWLFLNGFPASPKGAQQLRDIANDHVFNRKAAGAQRLPQQKKKIS